MSLRSTAILSTLALVATVHVSSVFAEDGKAEKSRFRTRIKVSKETTIVTEPLKEDGSVDYVGAMNAMASEGVTLENNAVVKLLEFIGPRGPEGRSVWARNAAKKLGMREIPQTGPFFVTLRESYARRHPELTERQISEAMTELEDARDTAMSGPWKATYYPEVAAWIEANAESLKVLKEAILREKFYAPSVPEREDESVEQLQVMAVPVPITQGARDFARFLICRSMFSLGEGNPQLALEDQYLTHRLGHLIASNAMTFFESLVGIAINSLAFHADKQIVQHANLTSRELLGYRDRLKSSPKMRPIADVLMAGERYMMLDIVFYLERHGLSAFADVVDASEEQSIYARAAQLLFLDYNMLMTHSHPWYVELHRACRIEDARARETALDKLEEKRAYIRARTSDFSVTSTLMRVLRPRVMSTRKVGDVMLVLLLPHASATTRAEDRSRAYNILSEIALTLAAYKADNGTYPKTLAQLKPKYIDSIPNDPRRDTAPIYERTADGFRLYCVGDNLKDDKGKSWGDRDDRDDDYDDLRFVIPVPEEEH